MRLIDIESESFLNEMREKQNACNDLIHNSDDETKTWTEREHWEGVYGVFVEIALALKEQRQRLAVPITRCKDCKWYDAELHCKLNGYGCGRSPDWFCADGKKEEE